MSLSCEMSWHYNVISGTIMSSLSKHPSQKFITASHFDKNIYDIYIWRSSEIHTFLFPETANGNMTATQLLQVGPTLVA